LTSIILASRSPTRAALLENAGVHFTVQASEVDEDQVKTDGLSQGLTPRQIALRLSELKALAISQARPGRVIGADQTLEMDGALFDKASSLEAARQRLWAFRGRTHFLHAAVAVARGPSILWRCVQTARLTMRTFSSSYLEDYLSRSGQEALSSVGCYRLESEGVQLFEEIQGDYFTILGLPLLELLAFLRRDGLLAT
jgi:septum formation protein